MAQRFKVVITDLAGPDEALEASVAEESGLPIDLSVANTKDAQRILELAGDADALIVCWAPITRKLLAGLHRCRVISRYGIGVDMIDIAAATEHGMIIANVARYCLEEVSTHAIGLLIALNRWIVRSHEQMRAGGWAPGNIVAPRRLAGQQLGLIGLGKIGQAVAAKARCLGLQVFAYDPFLQQTGAGVDQIPLVSLEDVLATSDYVSIHCPLNAATRHMVGARELALMKPTAFLINTARGAIVDQPALVDALTQKRIAGAALDVYETEPPPADDPLRRLDNVILTAHAASWSVEAVEELRRTAMENVVAVLRGGLPRDVVNREVLNEVGAMRS